VSGFEGRAAVALADPVRRENVGRFSERAADNRVAGLEDVDFQALRAEGERIRSEAIADLPALLDALQRNLERQGATVHRAATGADAASYITGVVLRHGREVVKGKSMAAEEIGLNERLQAAGIDVIETDLGEFIVQTAGEAPEHIIIPAIHKSRDDVRTLLEPLAGHPIGDDPAALTAFARAHLRERNRSRRNRARTCASGSCARRSASRASISAWPRRAPWCLSRTRATAACARGCHACISPSWAWSGWWPISPTSPRCCRS
jgi:L-lactate dehydrogenase complex protein LldF